MTRRRDGGFTLIELLLALSIGATLLVVMFGAVRTGLAAWGRGEARAMALESSRSLEQMLARAVGGAYPYKATPVAGGAAAVIFDGTPDRLTFVTVAPAIPAPIPIAFTIMSVSRDERGLTVRQLALPNLEPLDQAAAVVADRTVTAVRFRYLGEEPGVWTDRWKPGREDSLPRAVEIVLATAVGNRIVEQPPLVIPLRVLTP
jgi:general secretion pathway protein J